MPGHVAEHVILIGIMSDQDLLREMIREVIVIEEDLKSAAMGAVLAICTAAGCSPVKTPDGGVASPADYGIPGSMEVDYEDERERPSAVDAEPNKLKHPNPLAGQEPDLRDLGR